MRGDLLYFILQKKRITKQKYLAYFLFQNEQHSNINCSQVSIKQAGSIKHDENRYENSSLFISKVYCENVLCNISWLPTHQVLNRLNF